MYMPMVKAGVRAMDATTEFLTSDSSPQEIQDLNLNPTQWVSSGASKVLDININTPTYLFSYSREAGLPGWLPQLILE